MGRLARRMRDNRVLRLVRAFLTAEVLEEGLVSVSVSGTSARPSDSRSRPMRKWHLGPEGLRHSVKILTKQRTEPNSRSAIVTRYFPRDSDIRASIHASTSFATHATERGSS